MADSDSTNGEVRTLWEVTGELETLHHSLNTLNGLSRDVACDYHGDDSKETVMLMVDRVAVIANAIEAKLNDFDALVREAYKIHFGNKRAEVSHA